MRILIAGYQHETNTFAPSKADWAAFCRGDSFPAYNRGQSMQDQLTGVNIPIGGFIDEARARGWQLIPSVWAGAIPSADRKSTRLNSSHIPLSRMPSSA